MKNFKQNEFSIILPIRNGWPYIKFSISSILNQNYKNFNLIILDNCSSDESIEYIKSIKSSKIKIFYSNKSLSIEESWSRILNIQKKEYMTTIGHDDIFHNDFLLEINELINKYPDASIYHTQAKYIDEKGNIIRSCKFVKKKVKSYDYLKMRLLNQLDIFGSGYVFKSSEYDKSGGIPNFTKLLFADDALLLNLNKEYKLCSNKELISIRIHDKSESASIPETWKYLKKGLSEFKNYLFKQTNNDLIKVRDKYWNDFEFKYCENLYIYALVEASVKNQKILEEYKKKIFDFLPKINSNKFSLKTKVIAFLNTNILRVFIPILWVIYKKFK